MIPPSSSAQRCQTSQGRPPAMSSSSGAVNSQAPSGPKTYFKTPEGRYKLQSEKTHPSAVLHYSHGKPVSQLTIAYMKEKSTSQTAAPTLAPSSGGVRSAAARLLGAGNGSRTLSFVGGNGVSRAVSVSGRVSSSHGVSSGTNDLQSSSNYDGEGTYLIFNVADTLFISDLNSQEKDPIKSIHFSNANPVCHAFDAKAKDGHNFLIALHTGDVYSVSLRQQLQDPGRKLVGAQHYNKDGAISNSRCSCIAWVPESDGTFVVGHADGTVYMYEKSKDGTVDCSFPAIKDQTQFVVSHARSSKSNPLARWHICQGSINGISFSTDGAYMAVVGRDGYLRVFDFANELLVFGGKSYYGALLCCTWSSDGKYILTGGEDDLVQIWSMEDRKIVAWCEGHNSWVGGVSFDSYWSAPNSEGTGESVMYRFGSVGQDSQLLLWDLVMDEIVVPLPGPPGGSPTSTSDNNSAHWDSICPPGSLQPAPSIRDVPKLSPLVSLNVHMDPLSGLIFTNESVITISREGQIKIWARPDLTESNQSSSSEATISIASFDERPAASNNITANTTSFRQPSSLVTS